MITVIDYKMINLGSILNMLKKVGAKDVEVATTPDQIQKATKIIMPGVGSFDNAMKNLHKLDMVEPLTEKAMEEKIPFLGVCLGMQLMTKSSDEGVMPGLGFVDAQTTKFNLPPELNLKVPHMGWNQIKIHKENKLINEEFDDPRFYFVHSYYVSCNRPSDILTTTDHGIDFVSGFMSDNLIGVQFHPEKSHSFGTKLFKNFVEKF